MLSIAFQRVFCACCGQYIYLAGDFLGGNTLCLAAYVCEDGDIDKGRDGEGEGEGRGELQIQIRNLCMIRGRNE